MPTELAETGYQHTAFADWPEHPRMTFRMVLCDLGGDVRAYSTTGVDVSMPKGYEAQTAITAYAAAIGLTVKDSYWFPLGTDKPPEQQRHTHNQPYTDAPGYWFIVRFDITSK